MNLMRTLHTIRHLKPRQIAGQIVCRLRRVYEDPAMVRDWAPPSILPRDATLARAPLPAAPGEACRESMLAGRWKFLNIERALGFPPDWSAAGPSKLWDYNLHYFDFIWRFDYPEARQLALDWVSRYAPARGRVGWEPYPISIRVLNWCANLLLRHREHVLADATLRDTLWASIYRQCEWLSRHLEHHLLGNHLLENAAALVVAGSCFDGDAPDRWFRLGMRTLRDQLPQQILPDGGHFERSAMYQCRIVYLLSLLRDCARAEAAELVAEPLERSMRALLYLTHPDGQIALLNDSAFGIHHDPMTLAGHVFPSAAALPLGPFALPQTGYFGARTSDGSYIVCDAGPIGPDYLPGHAHGDMLSFELSLKACRVIVDAGVFDYEIGSMRDHCRSTRAHNTIEIGGEDQCEFWGAFRVGRRGTVQDANFQVRADGFELDASHDGYRRLRCQAVHRRRFRWHDRGLLLIRDELSSREPAAFVSRLHLHPDCSIDLVERDHVRVLYPAGAFSIRFAGDGTLAVEPSVYCPRFGVRMENQSICWKGEVASRTVLGISIGSDEPALLNRFARDGA